MKEQNYIGKTLEVNGWSWKRVNEEMAIYTSELKLHIGVANSVAYSVALSCLDKIRTSRRYHHSVKKAFERVTNEYAAYRRTLLHPATGQSRFFHLDDMRAEERAKYNNITDEDYFDFWETFGNETYQKNQHIITSLHDSLTRSLLFHGIDEADILAWSLVAHNVLCVACSTFNHFCVLIHDRVPALQTGAIRRSFSSLSMERIKDAWERASSLLIPYFTLTDEEKQSLSAGVRELSRAMCDEAENYRSVIASIKDNAELFRKEEYQRESIENMTKVLTIKEKQQCS